MQGNIFEEWNLLITVIGAMWTAVLWIVSGVTLLVIVALGVSWMADQVSFPLLKLKNAMMNALLTAGSRLHLIH